MQKKKKAKEQRGTAPSKPRRNPSESHGTYCVKDAYSYSS